MAVVVEVGEHGADAAWEEISERVTGKQSSEAETGAYFLGDPFPIAEQDEYDSGEAAHAILAGVSNLRNGLPVEPRQRIRRFDPSTGRSHWEDAPEAGAMSTSDGLGADAVPPRVERCPMCGSENICTQTESDDRCPYGCLDCGHQFEQPIGEEETSQLAGPYAADPAMLKAATPADSIAKWRRHSEALRDLQTWLVDPATDGEDAGDAIGRALVAAGLTHS
jgi:hypothetical protein